MSRFNSKKVSAAVVAGLLLAAPVFATVETVAPSFGLGQHVAYASESDRYIDFKDKNLEEALINNAISHHIIARGTRYITKDQALKVTELNLSNSNIKSIEGLEKFKNLTELYLNSNQISDITPLKNLTNLHVLSLNSNLISNLTPIASLTNLTRLHLDSNHISDLKPLASLTNLTMLLLDSNQISDITPLKNLTKVDYLNLSSNNISDITPLKNLTKIRTFLIAHNHISDAHSLYFNYAWCASANNASDQTITLRPKTNEVNLRRVLDDNNLGIVFTPKENIVNGVLTYKDGMKNPYIVKAAYSDSIVKYSATVNIDFSQANKGTESQAENISGQQESIELMTANCDVIKKANGKYRLIYAPKPFNGNVIEPLIPNPTAPEPLFPGLHNNQPPSRTTDNVKFIGEYNNTYFNFIDSKTRKPIETQAFLKASLYKQGKDILTGETPFKTLPKKIIFDDVDVNDKDVKDLIFGCVATAKGYSGHHFTPRTFKHFYTEDVEQAEDLSTTLLALLKNVNNVKTSNNFKNADDNLKQAYDKAITDGQAIYDKLSSTPEQVKEAQQNIQSALEALNGDKKAQAIKEQLNTATQQITSLQEQLEKAKQQHTADASTIQSLTQQLQQTKQQLEKLKTDKTLSDQQKQAEIDKLNGQITNLGKQIEKLTQENTSLKGQIATLQATISRLTEEANQCHVSDGAKAQELEKVKQQLTQAQSDLEKLKKDKTKSDTEKQKEIDKLSNQVTQLNQEITKLKQQDPASGSSSSAGESTGSGTSLGGDVSAPASTSALYRLYNPWTGEHLFTTDAHEVQTLTPLGWRYEGIIGQASMQEGTAVYRLYNPTTGEHHYTTNLDEVARCVANGWVKEGIAFYSRGDQAVYSMYNPYAKSFYHHYTSDENEIAQMVKDGWKKEEVKWYCTSIQPKNLIK